MSTTERYTPDEPAARGAVYPTETAVRQPAEPLPAFMIDDQADDAIRNRLLALQASFRAAPDTHLHDLRHFIQNPDAVPPESHWHQLTDRQSDLCRSYWFDDTTQIRIQADRQRREIQQQHSADQGRQLRARALEILLERTLAIQELGTISIKEA